MHNYALRVKSAEETVAAPPTYKDCMQFIRASKIIDQFWKICNKQGQISTKEYNFVLYYTIARIIFSNGARAELGYKLQLKFIHNYCEEDEQFKLVKIPDAKAGLTVAVMSMDDARFFEAYQSLRKKVATEQGIVDEGIFAFVQYSMKKIGHQVSENIKDIMVHH